MKHALRNLILITFYLLVVCTLCSAKIEELMTAYVITEGGSELLAEAAFPDGEDYHVFRTVEGGYWRNGMYAEELDSSICQLSFQRVGDKRILSRITLNARDIQSVQYSTRPLSSGARIQILTGQETGPDEYLIIFPPGGDDFDELRPGMIVEDRVDTVWLASAPEATLPFMENQIRRQLARIDVRGADDKPAPLDIYFRSASSLDVDVYSIPAIEQFAENMPRLAVLLLLVIFPVLLWLCFCVVFGAREKPRYLSILNLALTGANLAAASYVLAQIDLPSSLLPAKQIFDWSHYASEFAEISEALARFEGHESVQALTQHITHARQVVPLILLAGFLLAVAVIAAEIIAMHKIVEK